MENLQKEAGGQRFANVISSVCLRFFGLPQRAPTRRTPPPTSGHGHGEGETTAAGELIKQRFDTYGTTYPNGYRLTELGPAKAGKGGCG